MSHVDSFVSELLADFKHTLHSSDNEHLKVELGGNTHEEFHVKVVVESLEGSGSSASSNHVHHGGLNFNKIAVSEELSQVVNDFVSSLEDFTDGLVNNEVQVALAVTSVFVHNHLLLFSFFGLGGLGEHVHAVGQARDEGGADGELTRLGAAHNSVNTDDVSSLEGGHKTIEIALVELSSGEDLNLMGVTFQVNENELGSLTSNGLNSSRNGHHVFFIKRAFIDFFVGVFLLAFVHSVSSVELVRVSGSGVTLSLDPDSSVFTVLRRVSLFNNGFGLSVSLGILLGLFDSSSSGLLSFLDGSSACLLALFQLTKQVYKQL